MMRQLSVHLPFIARALFQRKVWVQIHRLSDHGNPLFIKVRIG